MDVYKKLDGALCLKQILEATSHKTDAVRTLNSHLTNHSRRIRHARDRWRSKGEQIRNVLFWTPSHERASVGWPVVTYSSSEQIQDKVEETCQKRWLIGMSGRERERERERGKERERERERKRERVRELTLPGRVVVDVDDDDDICVCVCICVYVYKTFKISAVFFI